MGEYLHGYSKDEQDRLVEQAKLLEPWVYKNVNFKKIKNLLEVGCGVGGQTEILLKKFPRLKITSIDISPAQIERAKVRLKKFLNKRVHFIEADATQIPVQNQSHDGAFLCWFLEHVPDPLKVLKEVKTKLKPGSPIICTEVQNNTFFVEPYSPNLIKYWFDVNDFQWSEKGHPFIGSQLGGMLKRAGFKNIKLEPVTFLWDSRDIKQRQKYTRYMRKLLLSGAPQLIKAGRVTQDHIDKVNTEFDILEKDPNSVILIFCFQATANS